MTETQRSAFFTAPKQIPPPFDHQRETTQFIVQHPEAFILNDPGTGKTRSMLDAFVTLREQQPGARLLVLAPKAILEVAWCDDAEKFTPQLRIVAAYAKNREAAFKANADIVVTNHDAVKWIAENPWAITSFTAICIDESTAYKNRAAQRSKALKKLIVGIPHRVLMTGTPMPQGLEDVWHQALLLDDGARLGKSYYGFRNATYTPVGNGAFTTWEEKEGAREVVADLLSDITIRFELEKCISMPPRVEHTVFYDMPAGLKAEYVRMVKDALLELDNAEISAINAAAKTQKLLQIASGAVYDGEHNYHVLDTGRYDLVAQLCDERKQTLIGFLWGHQKVELLAALKRAGIENVAVIDGATKNTTEVVRDFQEGRYRVLLAHPKSASHGLTLIKGTTLIWASPTYEAERFIQFEKRIYRAGQTERTEFIRVAARGTLDELAYARTDEKLDRQADLLNLLQALRTTI